MLTTTFELLRGAGACPAGYNKLAAHLGGVTKYGRDAPISLLTILNSNGLDDALWSLRAVCVEQAPLRDRLASLLGCDYAERVLPLYNHRYPKDDRPREAIRVARLFARGQATAAKLAAAWAASDAASDAAWAAAWAARAAARAAAWAAASDDARAAAWAASDAARAAAWAATRAARAAASDDARAAAWAASDAEHQWQTDRLRWYLTQEDVTGGQA